MSGTEPTPRVGIVIPTLGLRPDYLTLAIESIRSASTSDVFIMLVAPSDFVTSNKTEVDGIAVDEGKGLAAAINLGISKLPQTVELVNWLGDDDLLSKGSLDITVSALETSNAPYVFGRCNYIDHLGNLLFVNRSGRWAVHLMKFGPQLIPQPGSLFRRSVFEANDGLNTQYKWAFDLDIFIRLSRNRRPIFVPQTLSSFRWHDESLSVGGRRGSVAEASQIRKMNLHPVLRAISFLWEPFMRQLILRIGQRIKTPSDT